MLPQMAHSLRNEVRSPVDAGFVCSGVLTIDDASNHETLTYADLPLHRPNKAMPINCRAVIARRVALATNLIQIT